MGAQDYVNHEVCVA